MASAVDKQPAAARLAAVAAARCLPTATRGSQNSYTTSGDTTGVWRILRLFEELGVTATIYAVGKALALNPEVGRQFARQDLEVASHNCRWIDYADVPEDVEREHILMAKNTIREVTGEAPVGCC